MLNALVQAYSDVTVGVTSVGLDGEELDAVTYLPKPRIRLTAGTLCATAEDCLKTAEAKIRIVRRTGIMTGLGEIVVVEVLSEGIILVGGPSTASATEAIVRILRDLGARRIFLDGAFARSSHAAAGEAMVYVAGAHLSASMDAVVRAAKYAIEKFTLPAVDPALAFLKDVEEIGWIGADHVFHPLGVPSAVGSADAVLDAVPRDARWLFLPKALGPTFARRFVERRAEHECGLVVLSPLSIVADGDALRHLFLLRREIRVLIPMKVLFVGANPFSPAGHRFEREAFLRALSDATGLPAVDVMEESA